MISPTTIDAVRELSILDIVQKYVTDLKKSGSTTWKAKSPFTEEKTASFYIVTNKNIFKDFSSGKGGNGVTFVMEKLRIPYVEAIKELCGQFSIPCEYEHVTEESKQQHQEIELLYKLNEAAARKFSAALLDIDGNHPAFKELIDKRRFEPDTIIQWQIGFAPGQSDKALQSRFLTEQLINKGYYEQAKELGIIKTKGDTNYDAYRNRIMFPIVDHHGRFVGFGARALSKDNVAKYLNSSESRVFNKSKLLFGLHFAAQAIRKSEYAIMMEGYTDVISFHQAGFNNTVGTCGTSLTEEQCKLLKKYTSRVVLIYDGDAPGQAATLRAIDELMKVGFQVSVVPMPAIEGKKVDPDELVRMF